MKKILWVGDAGIPSGFARASHEIINRLDFRNGGPFEVTVMGINYRGDPHQYPYPIYSAGAEGDPMGIRRFVWMCDLVQPDAVVIQQDGWNLPFYMQRLRAVMDYARTPVIASVAVDGDNFQAPWLKDINLAVFWTEFGRNTAMRGGYTGPTKVIPLGVDLETYHPVDKAQAREAIGCRISDAFIIGNVNRNQPRKRWDLTVRYFAEWLMENPGVRNNVFLYLHTAPTGDTGVDIGQLAHYYGIFPHVVLRKPDTWYGISESDMCATYNSFDIQISTTQGEGFGLTTFEGMACGVPQIVPAWAALEEITKDAAYQVPCTSTAIGPPYVNVLGGVASEVGFKKALTEMYNISELREMYSQRGLQRVREARYQWDNIGASWITAIEEVCHVCEMESRGRSEGHAETPGGVREEVPAKGRIRFISGSADRDDGVEAEVSGLADR